jgi:hypothetical protein
MIDNIWRPGPDIFPYIAPNPGTQIAPSTWALEQIVRQQSEKIDLLHTKVNCLLDEREATLGRLSVLEQRLGAMRDWGDN